MSYLHISEREYTIMRIPAAEEKVLESFRISKKLSDSYFSVALSI